MEERTDIELRSEKVRNVVGKMPPPLLRVGITVITGVLLVLLGLLYYIPYPQLKIFPVRITTDSTGCHAIGSLPISDARMLKARQAASIQVERLTGDYQLNGEITAFVECDGNVRICLRLRKRQVDSIPESAHADGVATIELSRTSILGRILK